MGILGHRLTRVAFGVVAVAAVAVAFVRALEDTEGVPFPTWHRIALASLFLGIGLACAGGAWAAVISTRRFTQLAPGFFVAQLAKYVPGSVWQGVGQVMHATDLGVPRGAATVAFLVQLGTQVVAGAVLSVLVIVGGPPGWLLALGMAGPVLVVTLHRRLLRSTLRLAVKAAPSRFEHLPDTLPSQRAILAAAAFGIGTLSLMAVGYALLLPDLGDTSELIAGVGAFALAWTLGFLVLPLPSGLGVREFVLVAALGSTHETAAVLGAAIALRLLTIIVEAVMAAAAMLPMAARRQPT